LHGVLAGSDLSALAWLFAASGTAVLAAAVWRYWAEAPRPSRARGAHPTERGSAP